MSFAELPEDVERQVREYAEQRHVSRDEAILNILKQGLSAEKKSEGGTLASSEDEDRRIQDLLGEPLSPEDAAIMDEVVEEAMKAREGRWERWLGA